MADVFARWETKFILDAEMTRRAREVFAERLKPDPYFRQTICNVYYDTPNFELARRTLDHPPYREKIRMRSYGTPTADSKVYFEIKKKVDGVVYKRRATMTLREAEAFGRGEDIGRDSQILRELAYTVKYHGLVPKIYLSYFREAYYEEGTDLRVTLDTDVRYRFDRLSLAEGDDGRDLLEEGVHLLEVKTKGGLPRWLLDLTGGMQCYPARFSKYGKIYSGNFSELWGGVATPGHMPLSLGDAEGEEITAAFAAEGSESDV